MHSVNHFILWASHTVAMSYNAFRPAPLPQLAVVPFGFRRRVSW
jgi:hypothetical protein